MPDLVSEEGNSSDMLDCLRECLKQLPDDRKDLILDYHLYHGRAKVELHREMAAELSISEGALRTRAHHLRASLEECVVECLKNLTGTQKSPATS